MDEESHSTSQDYFNSREAVWINTNPLFQIVNPREVHCALCETIYSPSNEANRSGNLCRDCKVWLGLYNEEESWQALRESRQRVEESWQRFEPHRQRVEPHRQDLMEAWWDLGGNRLDLEENRQNLQETQWEFEVFRQLLEPHQQRIEQIRIEAQRRLEETQQRHLEETQRHSEEVQQRFEPHRQLVKRCLECLPCLVITEEHEKKHNGLGCAICLDPLSVGSFVNQLPCLHFFHPLCIVPWLKVRMSCPTCRYKLSSVIHNETTDSSVRDREGRRGGWFLFAAAPIVSLVGIALVECFQNFLGDGRGRGSTGHAKFSLQCQQQVRTFSSGSSSTRTSNSRENN